MLCVKRDAQGRIEAAMEVRFVDEQHQGIVIGQLEVSQGADGKRLIAEMVGDVARYFPTAQYAFWLRENTKLVPHFYTRKQLLTYANRAEEVVA